MRRLLILGLLLGLASCNDPKPPAPSPAPPPVEKPAPAPHPAPVPAPQPPPDKITVKGIPRAAASYKRDLIRNAQYVWGLGAPVATFAAQIQQESAWNANIVAQDGGVGLAQFMPKTAAWISTLYPDDLKTSEPSNPVWAMRALLHYDQYLWDRVQAVDQCNRMAKTLAAYNGGETWLHKDEALAGPDRLTWWGKVELENAGRSAGAWSINRSYPTKILKTYEPLYLKDAWGLGSCGS